MTNLFDDPCPPFDRYGAKQLVLQSHVGTLYDKHQDILAMVLDQQQEIKDLRRLLNETLEVVAMMQPR